LQAKELAKRYTEVEDENTAVFRFKEVLRSRDMFFNDAAFPANESGEEAFMKCADEQGARVFCPTRWRALQKWINSTKHVSCLSSCLFYDDHEGNFKSLLGCKYFDTASFVE